MKQLSLLEWTAPACRMIPFPCDRRIGKVRRTAEILSTKNGDAASAYWRQVVNTLARQLDAAGVHETERDRQCRLFFEAVQGELRRLTCRDRHPGGDAA